MSNAPVPSTFIVISALVLVQVIFGLNYIISKFVVSIIPPLLWGSIRNIISFLLLLIIALTFYRKSFIKKDFTSYIWPLIGFAVLGGILNQAFFLVGLKHTTATNSAIINTMIPLFTILFVTILGQESLTQKRIIGFILSFSGVLLLRNVESFTLSVDTVFGDLLMLLNAACFGAFLALSKKFMMTHSKIWTTVFIFFYGSIGLTAFSFESYLNFPEITWNINLLLACSFSVVGATLITYFINNWALGYAKSTTVAILIYIQPIITVFINWYWLSIMPQLREISSSIIIFIGVVLVVFGGTKKRI